MSDRRDEVRRQLDQFVPGERVIGGRSRTLAEAKFVHQAEDVGLTFAWFGGHGVHVYDKSGREVDYFSVGDFKLPEATLNQVREGVRIRMKLEQAGSSRGAIDYPKAQEDIKTAIAHYEEVKTAVERALVQHRQALEFVKALKPEPARRALSQGAQTAEFAVSDLDEAQEASGRAFDRLERKGT